MQTTNHETYIDQLATRIASLALLLRVSPHSLLAGMLIASERINDDDIEQYGTRTRDDLARIRRRLEREISPPDPDESDHTLELGLRGEHPIDEIMRRYRDALNALREDMIDEERGRLIALNDPAKVEHGAKLIRESVQSSWSPARIVRYIERAIFMTCETTTPTTDNPQQPAPVKKDEDIADNPSEDITNPSRNDDRSRATEDTRHGTRSDQMRGDV